MTSDKNCGASSGDSSDLLDGYNHREKISTKTPILLLVSDGGQANSCDSSQEVSRYLVIPVNLKGYRTNLLLSKIPNSMTVPLMIQSQLHLIISRTRLCTSHQI